MAMPGKKRWLAMIFIVACLAIPFGLTYYVSTEGFKDEYSMWQEEQDAQPSPSRSIKKGRVVDGRVTLVLGERVPVHNTSLVYKGIENGRVNVDLYLEDLDPTSAYPPVFFAN